MLADRKIALRVNGIHLTEAKVRLGKNGPELIITDQLLGEFAIDGDFTLEILSFCTRPRCGRDCQTAAGGEFRCGF
jgi:hypothetical protein